MYPKSNRKLHNLSRFCLEKVQNFGGEYFTAKKVFEIFKTRVDKTNWLWYSVLATKLDEPNRFAGLRCTRKADAPAKASVKNRIYAVPPYRVSSIPPFLSLFYGKRQHGLLCCFRRGTGCVWYHSRRKENKNGTCSLTTCTPRFLFCEGNLPLPSSLTRCHPFPTLSLTRHLSPAGESLSKGTAFVLTAKFTAQL